MFNRPLAYCCFNYLLALLCYANISFIVALLIVNAVLLISQKITLRRFWITASLIIFAFTMANFYHDYRERSNFNKIVLTNFTLKVRSDFAENKSGGSFTTKINGKKVKVSFKGTQKLEYGDQLILRQTKLFGLQRSKNFQISNYDDYLFLHGYSGKLVVKQNDLMRVNHPKFSLIRLIFRWKNSLVSVHKNSMSLQHANLLGSIIFGTSASPLERQVQDKYKKAGIIHLLVVSGSQIAIMVGVALLLARLLKLSGWAEFCFVSAFNLFFTISTGGGYSIVRAAIMAEITLSAKLFKRQKDFYTTLLLSGVILTLTNPKAVFDIGYQLSFLATFSLIYLTPLLQPYLRKVLPSYLADLSAVSLAPLLLTMPLTLYYFNSLALFSLPINILIAPWVEFLVVFGFISMILGKIWLPLAIMLNFITSLLISVLDFIVGLVDSCSFAYLYFPQIDIFTTVIFFALIFLVAEFLRTRQKIFAKAVALILIILFCSNFLNILRSPQFKITAIDVGQGDCFLIESENNCNILMDAGSDDVYNLAENILYPILIKKGIKKIDYIIISHPHLDHYSAVSGLVDLMPIGQIISHQDTIHSGKKYQNLLEKCRQKKIPLVDPQDVVQLKNTKGFVLTNLFSGEQTKDCNELSSIWLLKKGALEMLFTGDTTALIENKYLLSEKIDNIEILKVAHHGSKTASSPTFLEKVNAKVAVISVGLDNKYNLPSQPVIERLAKRDYFRTDLDGAVEITCLENNFKVRCFQGQKERKYNY